jgi:hypothetical protein
MLVYGSKRFDSNYGSKTTAYDVWQATKKLAGYYIDGQLAGVGYTTLRKYSFEGTRLHSERPTTLVT